jgi:hypothetical protein
MSTNGSPASRRRSASVRWCVRQFWLPPHLDPSRPRPLATLARPRPDKLPLKLCRVIPVPPKGVGFTDPLSGDSARLGLTA